MHNHRLHSFDKTKKSLLPKTSEEETKIRHLNYLLLGIVFFSFIYLSQNVHATDALVYDNFSFNVSNQSTAPNGCLFNNSNIWLSGSYALGEMNLRYSLTGVFDDYQYNLSSPAIVQGIAWGNDPNASNQLFFYNIFYQNGQIVKTYQNGTIYTNITDFKGGYDVYLDNSTNVLYAINDTGIYSKDLTTMGSWTYVLNFTNQTTGVRAVNYNGTYFYVLGNYSTGGYVYRYLADGTYDNWYAGPLNQSDVPIGSQKLQGMCNNNTDFYVLNQNSPSPVAVVYRYKLLGVGSYNYSEIQNNYTSDAIETTNQTFFLRFNGTNISSAKAYLFWNGTNYSFDTENSNSTHWNFTKYLTIPYIDSNWTNSTFYWNITLNLLNGTTVYNNTTYANQTIYQMNLTNCSGGGYGTTPSLNFSLRNEQDNNLVKGTIESTNNISVAGGSFRNISTITSASVYNASLCIYPTWANYSVNSSNYYYNTSIYTPRFKNLNLNISNASQSHDLFLLNSSGIFINFWVYSGSEPAGTSGAIVYALRLINGIWQVVQSGTSDSSGRGVLFLDPNYLYNIDAEKGNLTGNTTYAPNVNILLKINLGGISPSNNWIFNNTQYYLNPTNQYLVYCLNNSTGCSNSTLFNYTVSSSQPIIEWYALNLSYWNNTSLYYSNVSGNPNGGSILVNVNISGLNNTLQAQTWLKLQNLDATSFNRTYYIVSNNGTVSQILTETRNFGLDESTLNLIAFFIAFIIAGALTGFLRTGGGLVFLGVLTAFQIYGWFNLNFLIALGAIEVIGIIVNKEIY